MVQDNKSNIKLHPEHNRPLETDMLEKHTVIIKKEVSCNAGYCAVQTPCINQKWKMSNRQKQQRNQQKLESYQLKVTTTSQLKSRAARLSNI